MFLSLPCSALLLSGKIVWDFHAGGIDTWRAALVDPLRIVAGFALVMGPWIAYSLWQFGDVFPNTLSAKVAQGDLTTWPLFSDAVMHRWWHYWANDLQLFGFTFKNLWRLLVIAGLTAAVLYRRRFLILVAWSIAYIVRGTVFWEFLPTIGIRFPYCLCLRFYLPWV